MTRETRKTVNTIVRYVVLIVVGFIMIYPLIWMVGATFKTNNEIFSGIGFIPKNPTPGAKSKRPCTITQNLAR